MPAHNGYEGNGGRSAGSRWATTLGLLGAIAVVVLTVVLWSREPLPPEQELRAPPLVQFSAATAAGEALHPGAIRLRNLIVACATGDMEAAGGFIDPTSELAGRPGAVCGPVLTTDVRGTAIRYHFDRIASDDGQATVYLMVYRPGREGERYAFFMRKVGGQWYFSVP